MGFLKVTTRAPSPPVCAASLRRHALAAMRPSFFEGPEKKVELVLTPDAPSLRQLGQPFWREVVKASKAEILSLLQSPAADAYLLSESSLFVYDDHLTMITCGQTALVNAVCLLIERLGANAIALLIYERKNEHFPDRQPTSFYQDIERLHARLPGQAVRFGDEHDHHVNLFYSAKPFVAEPTDTTLEILMHGLPNDAASRFIGCRAEPGRTIAEDRGIASVLPGFQIDEHAFTPAGYSMNALKGDAYYTIHVTPEQLGSYVSFETNIDFRDDLGDLVSRVVGAFRPRSFDVLTFAPQGPHVDFEPPGYRIKDRVGTRLASYEVSYWHCYRPIEGARPPAPIPIGATH